MPPAILVVEDDVPILSALQSILLDEGYTVHTAVDGHAALDVVARHAPALIVSDIRMPGGGGLDPIEQLRTVGCPTPVVLTSASELPTGELPSVRFLRKPFDLDELLDAVEQALQAPPSAEA